MAIDSQSADREVLNLAAGLLVPLLLTAPTVMVERIVIDKVATANWSGDALLLRDVAIVAVYILYSIIGFLLATRGQRANRLLLAVGYFPIMWSAMFYFALTLAGMLYGLTL
jgi:hypothetical protein